jgi:hypothetical protein
MKISIPRDNPEDMILYTWKIIDLPSISYEDLLYKVIFEYYIFDPKEASLFIDDALTKGLLVSEENSLIRLSDELSQKFKEWQKLRQLKIKENIMNRKKREKVVKGIQINNENNFNHLIKKIADNRALNRAVTISDDALDITIINKKKGVLEAEIKGTSEKSYIVNINIKEQRLLHNCHDFETRRAKAKMFCKHLIKLFLYLKKENEELAIYFLENIINQINDWDFSS